MYYNTPPYGVYGRTDWHCHSFQSKTFYMTVRKQRKWWQSKQRKWWQNLWVKVLLAL
uniref:Uncharacterized protein n=1 Tax=Anguilla anguilla TaxID=7936 RepID=A0A0E9THW2_ANGAN